MSITILGIESSCDDTSAAIIRDCVLMSNVMQVSECMKPMEALCPNWHLVPISKTSFR